MQKRVLVVDDDAGIVEALQVLLEEAGYHVKITTDGSTVQEDVFTFSPNVVLLDIWMSGQNGHDICKHLKSKKDTKKIPVIMISANRDTEKIANDCGADDFIAKPFEIDELLSKVERYAN